MLYALLAAVVCPFGAVQAQCVADPVVQSNLQFDVDYLFAGLDRSLGGDFPAWLARWQQDNTTDPTPVFVREDNCQNGIDDDDHLDLLAAILEGEPSATVLSGINPADVAAIRASYAANRAKVRPDLTLTIIFVTVNIIEEIEKDDPDFGASLQDLVAAYMTIGDAESVAFIRNLLITLGEIFIEVGVDNGDIPAIVEGLTKTTLRNTVNANYVTTRYDCYGDAPGATKPNLLGDTGNIGGNGQTNETAYAAAGRDRQAWLIAKGVAQPPLEIATLPTSVTTTAGVPAALSAELLGGTGAPATYDWKRVNPSTGATSPAGTGNPFGPAYPLAADAGTFQLFVCDGTWQRAALPVTYTVNSAAFAITTQPQGATRDEGDAVTFSVAVQGGERVPSYQWYRGQTVETLAEIDGATSSTLNLSDLQPSDAGLYQVRIVGGPLTAATTLESNVVALDVIEFVDNVPPVLSLVGSANIGLECGGVYTELGATAIDTVDGDLGDAISIEGSVNTAQPGTYTLTYRVADLAGNSAELVRTVNVTDTGAPVLTLVGANPLVLECKAVFSDPGAAANDVCDGELDGTIQASGTVGNTPGTYTRTYSVSDATGNSTQVTRTVIVQDTIDPIITRIGPATITLACGTALNDPGAVASDACGGNLDASVEILGDPVDTGTAGTYTRTYRVADAAGNDATVTRSFVVTDTAPPVLTLNGTSPLQINCGAVFNDPGATALDACQGVIATVNAAGNVNTNSPGTYNITYTATDAAGNLGQIARTVQVTDTTAPVVTLLGAESITLACGSAFNDPGATAVDACGNVAVNAVASGTVNTTVPGTYTRTYRATDTSGNAGTVTRTVIVTDTVPPTLTLNGAANITLACGATFNDPGASASDACAGILGAATASGAVDTATAGVYTRTYSATDPSGNTATTTRTVTVLAATNPELTLIGSSDITLACGTPYTEPGFSATLGCSPDLSDDVQITGEVDTETPGVYTLTYSVTAPGGTTATQQRTVRVEDTTAPVLTLLGDSPLTLACGAAFVDPGATALDACDGPLSNAIVATGTVNAAQPGTYTRTYTVQDQSGNSTSATRTVTVAGTTSARILLVGDAALSLSCGDEFVEPGYTAEDTCGEDATSRVTVTGAVDAGRPGDYLVTYSLALADGGPATATRTITVLPDCTITLLAQPDSLRLYVGQSAIFTVQAAGGSGPLSYQWQRDEQDLDAATTSVLRLDNLELTDAGSYACRVSDGFSEVVSDSALLEVFERPETGQQSADSNGDWSISLSELLRLIQFYNVGSFSCLDTTEDGYTPGPGDTTCLPHSTDYQPQNWSLSLSELLRAIQFYNTPGGAYRAAEGTEDGYAPGAG